MVQFSTLFESLWFYFVQWTWSTILWTDKHVSLKWHHVSVIRDDLSCLLFPPIFSSFSFSLRLLLPSSFPEIHSLLKSLSCTSIPLFTLSLPLVFRQVLILSSPKWIDRSLSFSQLIPSLPSFLIVSVVWGTWRAGSYGDRDRNSTQIEWSLDLYWTVKRQVCIRSRDREEAERKKIEAQIEAQIVCVTDCISYSMAHEAIVVIVHQTCNLRKCMRHTWH